MKSPAMSDPTQQNPQRQRAPGVRGHAAGIVAMVALAVALGAWFWMTRHRSA
jgi:hypothetical protein